uniref:Uncharacterized protein n=1 Tax=Rhizophora mucronata TaxID=61149 RepID=A0A2P2PQZ4_RHIMU
METNIENKDLVSLLTIISKLVMVINAIISYLLFLFSNAHKLTSETH